MLMRWDVINHLIRKYKYFSYLEVGYYKGWSFDNVDFLPIKIAVDPNPSKTPEQEEAKYGASITLKAGDSHSHTLYKMTSDEFFAQRNTGAVPFDVIFIDGLHEADQVFRDIENSLKHLAKGGFIVMHDCNPPKFEHTTTGIDGCWTGDTYKAVGMFKRKYMKDYTFYCVDTDWGVGIIQKRKEPIDWENLIMWPTASEESWNKWEFFDTHRKGLLSLISPEQFLEMEKPTDLLASQKLAIRGSDNFLDDNY